MNNAADRLMIIALLLLLTMEASALPQEQSDTSVINKRSGEAYAGARRNPDIRESSTIGPRGGVITAEDPDTGVGMYVIVDFPEGALMEETLITVVIHGTKQPGVLAKTHINGITILPEGLLMNEKVSLEVYNPPNEITDATFLYHVINNQFIIPLGSWEMDHGEGWIKGSFYVTGKYSLGTPTATEASAQVRKLAAYNPARPLSYAGEEYGTRLNLTALQYDTYDFPVSGGPSSGPFHEYLPAPPLSFIDDEECMRWQKTLTKVEAHLSWVEYFQFMGNTSGEQAEKRNAERALQEAIDDYLGRPAPVNKCGRYIKAASKYLESSQLLGIDKGYAAPLTRHFEQLVDECSFVFSVETREWINHPREEHDDGSITEEKMYSYCLIKCHIPWNEFLLTGRMKVRGEGNMSLHHENHWIGGDENTHEETNTNWEVEEIEGSVNMNYDDYGKTHPTANITIHWKGEAQSRMWGKRHGNPPYDFSGIDDRSNTEYKTYPIENGYSERIGDDRYGYSVTVYILKQPGDERDNPDDCF